MELFHCYPFVIGFAEVHRSDGTLLDLIYLYVYIVYHQHREDEN